ncbi:MAG: DNA-binding protein [Bdellovibrio sp. ArHS]|nr:MAG: DNA-binding protein [Bdellovibrio sp. ArHS]
MRSLVEHITRLLVDQPETVTVTTYVGPKTTVYRVNCAKENLGQVIGSQGKTIMGLRAVVHAMTARTGIRSIVEIPV